MKITNREKIMLIVLSLIGVFALSYFLLFSPQFDKIAQLAGEELDYLQKVTETKARIASIDKLEADVQALAVNLEDKTAPYYPEIIQEKLIVILDGIIGKTGVASQTIGFGAVMVSNPPAPASAAGAMTYPLKEMVDGYLTFTQGQQAGDGAQQPAQNLPQSGDASADTAQIESMDVTIHIEGAYEQWLDFIKEIEALKRMILIENLSVSSIESEKVSSDIRVKFYALPKIQEQDADYLDWPYKGVYGKENLFMDDDLTAD